MIYLISSIIFFVLSPVLADTPAPLPAADTVETFGASSVDFTWVFLKMVFAMLFVIALAIVVIRYIIPKLTMMKVRSTRSDLEIQDRIPLDAKKALYVIKVEGRRLLIAVSDSHLGLITELDSKNEAIEKK